jgi:hypothetical protein
MRGGDKTKKEKEKEGRRRGKDLVYSSFPKRPHKKVESPYKNVEDLYSREKLEPLSLRK